MDITLYSYRYIAFNQLQSISFTNTNLRKFHVTGRLPVVTVCVFARLAFYHSSNDVDTERSIHPLSQDTHFSPPADSLPFPSHCPRTRGNVRMEHSPCQCIVIEISLSIYIVISSTNPALAASLRKL